ncbi:hypothetical protein MTR_8g088480 [Medicago truncatula]|uniref:Uncharacterized protein n=1 Tax=Medicago truncatula TaxID=3880 RepID=G7L8R9_MEDTR|nr:hypothetical protein MTR_8g088480 [Medicago truncatula]
MVVSPYLSGRSLTLFYPGGSVVDSLPYTILGSATKRLKESDLVMTQPSNNSVEPLFLPNTSVSLSAKSYQLAYQLSAIFIKQSLFKGPI